MRFAIDFTFHFIHKNIVRSLINSYCPVKINFSFRQKLFIDLSRSALGVVHKELKMFVNVMCAEHMISFDLYLCIYTPIIIHKMQTIIRYYRADYRSTRFKPV